MGWKIKFNKDEKYDIQLSKSLIRERRLAEIFLGAKLERIELKTETYQWERTGNLAIEYRRNGKRSGISVTEADMWVHELRRDDDTLVYLMFPIARLKQLTRAAIRAGWRRLGVGDGGKSDVALIQLRNILR